MGAAARDNEQRNDESMMSIIAAGNEALSIHCREIDCLYDNNR